MTNKEKLLKSLKEQGCDDEIVEAFKKVDREKYLSEDKKEFAYEDVALPIGYEQTISQPSTIAFMLDLLNLHNKHKVLEVGCGSGYLLNLLAEMGYNLEIYGTELLKELADLASERLKEYSNVKIYHTPNSLGLSDKAPFDRIIVSAGSDKIPKELFNQLKEGGVMVIPINNSLYKITKTDDKKQIIEYPGFQFVPLKY
ncbi:MAG: protein-L-isoaspartate O-methyltransferase [Parcubacteria group bacterium]